MIFNEDMVGGLERVTTARGAGTARGLNKDQIVKIARLTGCKNLVGKRKKFISKRSLSIVVLHHPCRDRATVVACAAVGVVFHLRVSGGCWLPGQHLPPAVARCMSRRTDGSH